MKKILILLMVMILLVGCSKDEPKPIDDVGIDIAQGNDKNVDSDKIGETATQGGVVVDYPFEYNNVTIHMNTKAEPVVKALGEPFDYFEAPSCAFQGLDKIYYYSGFELSTYPNDGIDYISNVNLMDDSVSTLKGISLGDTLEEIIKAYGDNYKEEAGFYTYTLGETELTFVIEDGIASAISYFAVIEELRQ